MQIVIIPYRHPKGHSLINTNSFPKVFIPHNHKFNTNLIQYEFSSPFKFHIKVHNHQNPSCVDIPNTFQDFCQRFRQHLNFTRIFKFIYLKKGMSFLYKKSSNIESTLVKYFSILHRFMN